MRIQIKQALSLVKNEHVFSPKTVIKTSKSRGYELTLVEYVVIVVNQRECGTNTRPRLVRHDLVHSLCLRLNEV